MFNQIKRHDIKHQAASVRLEHSPTPNTENKTMDQILKKETKAQEAGY